MAAWDKKPNTLIKKRLYNLMADNNRILTRILNLSQKQLNQLLKLYSNNPETLYTALQYWISQGTVLNGVYSEELAAFTANIGKAYAIGLATASGTPAAAQEIIKATMQDSIMNYVTKLDSDIKQKLANTLTEGYTKGQFPKQTINQMQKNLEYNKYRASMITHTETMRASNAANWSQSKVEGATHFTVDVRPGACKTCISQLLGKVFKIDEVKYIPPIHPWCSCVPKFFMDESEAKDDALRLQQRNDKKLSKLLDKGYLIPENGTGPLSPEAQAQRAKN